MTSCALDLPAPEKNPPALAAPLTTPPNADERYAEMMARFLGDAVMAAMADDDVTEIYLNPRDNRLRLDTRSRGRVVTPHLLDPHRVEMFLNAAASSLNVMLHAATPRLEAELPSTRFRGSRLQGFIAPAASGPAFNIRKPPAVVYTLDQYVASGILTCMQRDVLREAVTLHCNIVIAGGTNSGKTTLANAVLREVTDQFPHERLVILEDTVELQCAARDHLALRTGPGLTLSDLVKSTLRTSPNRIVVGEVRGAEALDLLDVWATGHPGGIGTCHATSAAGTLLRLDRLAQRNNVPTQMALIAEAVDLIVVIAGSHGERRVTEMARVGCGPDARPILTAL